MSRSRTRRVLPHTGQAEINFIDGNSLRALPLSSPSLLLSVVLATERRSSEHPLENNFPPNYATTSFEPGAPHRVQTRPSRSVEEDRVGSAREELRTSLIEIISARFASI